MLKLPEKRRRWGKSKGAGRGRGERRVFFSPLPSPLSFFRPRTYRKGYYFYSPQSSTVVKSKMVATTILWTRTRFTPALQAIYCIHKQLFMPWTTYHEEKKYIAAMKELHLTHPRRPRGGQSGREKRRDKSFQALCLKTFVAPFLPARLTAPGSPRMHLTVHFTRFRIGEKRRKQLAWAKTKIREVVRRGERVLSFPPSPGHRIFPFSPTAEPGPSNFTWNDWLPRTAKREIFNNVLFNRVTLQPDLSLGTYWKPTYSVAALCRGIWTVLDEGYCGGGKRDWALSTERNQRT